MNCDEDKVIACIKKRYVIGTMINGKPRYLKLLGTGFVFSEDINTATMTLTREYAIELLDTYKAETGDTINCAILPISIIYEILEDDFR